MSIAAPSFPNISEGFLLDEDNALRNHLIGMSVSDDADRERPVGVWYSHPDIEIREQKYPYMVITLIDVNEAPNRIHAGRVEVTGVPLSLLAQNGIEPVVVGDAVYNANGLWSDVWADQPSFPLRFFSNPPLPVQIDYQVRAFSRHPRHSRQIVRDFLASKVSYRYSFLDMSGINGEIRRMELIDISHGESVENNKRLFVSAFTLRVDSFMPYGDNVEVFEDQYVIAVIGDLKPFATNGETYLEQGSLGWTVTAYSPEGVS